MHKKAFVFFNGKSKLFLVLWSPLKAKKEGNYCVFHLYSE